MSEFERGYFAGYRAALGAAAAECRKHAEALDHGGNTYTRYGDAIRLSCAVLALRAPDILDDGIAAVAELLAADREFDHAMARRIEASNRIVRGDRSDDAFRERCSADHAYDRATDRRKTALTRIGGAP